MQDKIEFEGVVLNGHLPPAVRLSISAALPAFNNKPVTVKIEPIKRKRSLKQNSFYFHKIVPAVRQYMLKEQGQNLSLEETHDMIVKYVWKFTKWVEMPDGGRVEVRRSSTEADTMGWEEKIELTRAYFAPVGLQLPYPNENILV
jgi:hypothetical protein